MQDADCLHSELTAYSIWIIVKKLCAAIMDKETGICEERKIMYLNRLVSHEMKGSYVKALLQCYNGLTHTDIRYLLCFAIEMEYSDIQILFHIEKKTVYSVRYRIRKKLKNYKEVIGVLL